MPELVWDGKYDTTGTQTNPLRVALPFQTVETVNESAQERQRSLFSIDNRNTEWRNRLIWGDNKYVLPALLNEFPGAIDLVYIDPPFATGQDFSRHVRVENLEFEKQPSLIEQKAYRDTWGRGLNSYLSIMRDRICIIRELLSPTGSLIVHIDYRVAHYLKLVMDEIFGEDRMLNEVIWHYRSGGGGSGHFGRKHDTLLIYSKTDQPYFNDDDPLARVPHDAVIAKKWADKFDPRGKLRPDVWDISRPPNHSEEWVGYPTQKPAALLEVPISVLCPPNGLVADFFCGSGTAGTVAEKFGRRWILCDLGRFAIHTTRKRLLAIPEVKPFVVQNLGKYERQLWQAAEFGDSATARTSAYRSFILDLYHATPVNGYAWLHGLKNGRMVHVGTVDAPVTNGDVKQIVAEFRKAVGTGKGAPSTKGVDLLGWDFAFELNEVARQDAEKAGIDLRLVRIPREVLEKRAVEQGDIRFFELAALSVELKQSARKVSLTLEDFVIPLDDVPADVQKAVTHWSQWIDYWAVDWDNKDDTFHNEWQAYRTRKSKDLSLMTTHEYTEPGDYTVVVKVIDILGNDTTKTLPVKVVSRGA
ncbi:MAG: DNA methyltransferase [Ferrimicrobium sp.]